MEDIRQWLVDHPAISCRAVAIAIGLQPTTLIAFKNGRRELPEVHLPKLENELKRYGYNSTYNAIHKNSVPV
jgi:hypothetical protein